MIHASSASTADTAEDTGQPVNPRSLTPPARRVDPEAASVQSLVATAGAQLLNGRDGEFVATFAACAQFSPQRRYEATKLLIERGLTLSAQRSGSDLVELLTGLAAATLAALEQSPAEPVLLNYAGVLFYELWSLDAARALFLAARRLDPELPHLETNLNEAKARRRAQSARGARRRGGHLHPALFELSRRAERVAATARPATGLRLSLCMIVRNEEEMLGRCLAAAAPAVDEIIIVDTGSEDRTIEIAHEYGALVIERPWTGSFAEARNASVDAATGDWILYLDADEVLVEADAEALRRLRGHTWREAFFLHETNFTGHEGTGGAVVFSALRIFRNRPEHRFSGRLHEQIAHTLPTYLPERIHQSPVRIDHYGYLGSVRALKNKSQRNLELLLAQRGEGTLSSAFDHFNLGSEYLALDRFAAAAGEFERAWNLVIADPASGGYFVPTLAGRLVSALRQAGRPELAHARAQEALERFPDFTDLVYHQALALMALGREAEATAAFERCLAMGDAPSRYTSLVGAGTFMPRVALAEQRLRRGQSGEALSDLRDCAQEHPEFVGTYPPYLCALLATGVGAAAAVAEIESGLGHRINSTVRILLATTLLENGAAALAADQLRDVLARRPQSVPALEMLLDALLITRDFTGFEAALERFHACDLPERERRERLAQTYLRHGFLRSAGREWMAVVEREPDAAALTGLAEVARRNGQAETARVFAAEALKLAASS
ncbi:MAG TPA: glycosyltransferase [Solirubrobacteraceae bacterium]|nr:glycosyltransferase [Solirubrobacteraceae bacterium]